MIDDYTVAFVPGKDGLASADVRTKWFDAIARSSSLNVALQTPQWVQYRLRSADDLRLCVMRNSEKEIVGVTPLSKWTHGLPFYVKGRCLWSASLNATRVMGEIPLMPEEPQAYALFLESLMREAGVIRSTCVCPWERRFGAHCANWKGKVKPTGCFIGPRASTATTASGCRPPFRNTYNNSAARNGKTWFAKPINSGRRGEVHSN